MTAALRRVTGTWREPEPWTVAVLLVTGVVVIARHPIARMIGTEVDDAPLATPVVATAPVVPSAAAPSTAPSAAAGLASVPTHAPRDPFHALVGAGQKVLAPQAPAAAAAVTPHASRPSAAPAPAHAAPATAGDSCTGTTYRVVAGDTLWTIAARTVKSADTGRVTVAWHRLYQANRPPLGNDPSIIPVGVKLCVPDKL